MITPAEITLALVGSSYADPKGVVLHEWQHHFNGEAFKVVAGANGYKNGFAIHVEHAGKSYAVAGFDRKPSVKALEEAVAKSITYGFRVVQEAQIAVL